MTLLPKAIYRFNAVPIKIPKTIFTEKFLNLYGDTNTPTSQTLRKKNRAVGIMLPLFRLYYKATAIKRV